MTRQLTWILALIACSILALMSISPFLTDQMPITDDGNLHVYRSIVLDDAIRNDGTLYPRYASGFAYGYGASLFNYFPPTSYYPTVFFHALGLEWVPAWKAGMIFLVVMAGFGTWLWARQWVDDIGAIVAATAYLYAPYTLFDTVARGSSNEFAGMALLPFALWGFTRLARSGKRSDYLLAILCYALFIIAHNVMTLYGSLLLVGYCAFLILTHADKGRLIWQLGSAGIIAVLMTTFFWLPALTETDAVKINGVLDNLEFIDVTNTLRSLGEVFALPQTADPSRLQAVVPISFHWIALTLGIVGFFLPQPRNNDEGESVLGLHIFLFVMLGIVIFSQLIASADLWQSVRLLLYSQFAWRPMSIGSLVLALLSGIGASYIVRLIPTKIAQGIAFGVILALMMLYSASWLYRPEMDLQAESLADAHQYERTSAEPVLSSFGEYLPVQTLQSALDPMRFTDNSERLLSTETITVLDLEQSGTRFSAEIEVSEPSTVIIDYLVVPGWRARVDGERVDVMSVTDRGVIGLDVEAGTHSIEVWYAGSNLQQIANLVSLAALIAAITIAFFVPMPSYDLTIQNKSYTVFITAAIVGLLMFTLKAQVIDRTNNPFKTERFQNGTIIGVEQPLNTNFDNQVRLLGADLADSAPSGGDTTYNLYWTVADDAINTDYSSLLQVVNAEGIVIAEASNFYPGDLATSNWLPEHYLQDRIILEIPPYTPPIAHEVLVGVYQSDNGRRLDVRNADGNPIGIDAPLNTIQITRSETPFDRTQLPLPVFVTNGFSLLQIEGLPETVQVGDEMQFSWIWSAENPVSDFPVRLRWSGDATNTIEQLVTGYPQSEWQVGDIWRGYHAITVPPTLDSGEYTLRVEANGRDYQLRTPITVTVPERNFDLPDFENPINQQWENGIILRGYELENETITLYWQTEAIIPESLRLFVQLFDANGQLVRVIDGIPVNNTRPTTSWITEEVLATSYDFTDFAPTEAYSLLIGWYEANTGQRALLSDSDADAFNLLYPIMDTDN